MNIDTKKKKSKFNDGLAVSKKVDVVLNIFFLLLAFTCLYAILLVFSISISDEATIRLNGYRLIPQKINFDAYRYILLSSPAIVRAYGVTAVVTITGCLLSIIITVLYAYPLSRKSFKYRNVFAFIAYFTCLFSGGMVPWYIMYVKFLHVKNTMFALILPMLFGPGSALVMRTYFKSSVPESLIDAAKIDGAGEFYTLFKLVVPISKPIIATTMLFTMLAYWNDWSNAMLFITNEKLFPLQYLLYKIDRSIDFLQQAAAKGFGYSASAMTTLPAETSRMAIAVLAIGPMVLAYPFFQRFFVQGLTAGAVKE